MSCTPTISYNDFTGDGSTTQFTITFDYVNPNDLRVRTGTSPPYGYITSGFAPSNGNPQVIVFDTAPSGAFRIFRCTADAVIDATFQAGSAVRASDLNDNFKQLLYLSQEARAGNEGGIADLQEELDSKVDTFTPQAPITGSISGTTLTVGISAATTSAAGSMSANDKTKLDGVSGTAPITATHTANSLTIGITAATGSADGSMSAADKAKLDSIQVSETVNATFAESPDSSRTAFTFTGSPDITSQWDLTICVNGVIQQPGVDFTYASNTVTFTSAPIVGSEMWCMIKGFRSATGDWFSSITASMVPLVNVPDGYGLTYGSSQQDLNDIITSKLENLDHIVDALDARLDAIKVAVHDSTDFDSLKTRLLAILQ